MVVSADPTLAAHSMRRLRQTCWTNTLTLHRRKRVRPCSLVCWDCNNYTQFVWCCSIEEGWRVQYRSTKEHCIHGPSCKNAPQCHSKSHTRLTSLPGPPSLSLTWPQLGKRQIPDWYFMFRSMKLSTSLYWILESGHQYCHLLLPPLFFLSWVSSVSHPPAIWRHPPTSFSPWNYTRKTCRPPGTQQGVKVTACGAGAAGWRTKAHRCSLPPSPHLRSGLYPQVSSANTATRGTDTQS